jgi:excisionase family DNA binding protein
MPRDINQREVLNVEQAAELLGFSPYTIREKARLGEIPGRKTGREWRFLRTAVLAFCSTTESSEYTVKVATQRYTLRHSALATAVRTLIELRYSESIGWPSQIPQATYERMVCEVRKWDDTDDVYALGIMAPLYAQS